jgi:hypothetical protein
MPTQRHNPKVDAYIKKSRPFAQPILVHLRKARPRRMPPALKKPSSGAAPSSSTAASSSATCRPSRSTAALGFWGLEIGAILRQAGVVRDGAMGSLGRITSVAVTPARKEDDRLGCSGCGSHREWPGKEARLRPALASSSRPKRGAQNSARLQPRSRQEQEGRSRLCRLQSQLPPRIY